MSKFNDQDKKLHFSDLAAFCNEYFDLCDGLDSPPYLKLDQLL